MDAITTTTAPELSLEQCDELLVQGICNIRDAVLGYTLHGLTQTQISERVKGLGLKGSRRTIQRHVADLRDEGLLPEVGESERTQRRRRNEDRPNRQNGAMAAQPTTTLDTTNDQPDPRLDSQPAPVRTALCTVVPDLEPLAEATVVEDGTCIPMGTYEQQQGQSDYLEACRLINQLATVLERNAFQPRMFPDDWRSIHGGLRGLVETAEAQTRYSARVLEG
jgi:DNA-binding transcriptional ArsR family regulator